MSGWLLAFLLAAQVPIAPANVVYKACPNYLPQRYSCYAPDTATVYLSERNVIAVYHEWGHAYDFRWLNDRDRAKLKRLLGYKQRDAWFWDEDENPLSPWGRDQPPGEQFADHYAQCALGVDRYRPDPRPRPRFEYYLNLERVCRFIRWRVPYTWHLRSNK